MHSSTEYGVASILWPAGAELPPGASPQVPASVVDLQLDAVFRAMTAGREEYDLLPVLLAPLPSREAVRYRLETLQALDHPQLRRAIEAFGQCMRTSRGSLASAAMARHPHERARHVLDAAASYCDAVDGLVAAFAASPPEGSGLAGFARYLADHAKASPHQALARATRRTTQLLAAVRYSLLIRGRDVVVAPHRGEADFGAQIAAKFRNFHDGAARDFRVRFAEQGPLNHVEEQILDRVAETYESEFTALRDFATTHASFIDPAIARFDREIQFFVAYLAFIDPLRGAGLPFCYPALTSDTEESVVRDTFDLALAATLVPKGTPVVRNDAELRPAERLVVVTGPNHGGKTTFARCLGQLHYLAALGLAVPGRSARLRLADRVLTHFSLPSEGQSAHGQLYGDLARFRDIVSVASERSVVILNEPFASTTAADALYLGQRGLGMLARTGALVVLVTFLAELADFDEHTVSVVCLAAPDDPLRRTYQVQRRPPDGLAHALALAEKFRVTRAWILARVAG